MGTVYVAWQNSLRRQVAVKVLNNAVGLSQTSVIRFQREAQAAAKLNHPNIVPIFGQGNEEGIYYYIMELVQGRNLNHVLHELRAAMGGSPVSTLDETVVFTQPPTEKSATIVSATPQPTRADALTSSSVTLNLANEEENAAYYDRIAEHIAAVADALDYAHRQGVIHRDIKPHNLILADSGRLCITDFGLARMVAEPGVTVTGELVGSPLYMSPEQVSGTSRRIDHRTDIYSLGATLYEWLCLRPLCPGETREQVISQILTQDPNPPRFHDRRIPVDLETICLKAVEKDLTRRYASAGAMRDDLLRFLRRHEIHAKRSGPLGRLGRFVTRHRVGSFAILAAVLAVLLATSLVLVEAHNRRKLKHLEGLETRIAAVEDQKEELEKQVDIYQKMLEAGVQLGQKIGKPSLIPQMIPAGGTEEANLPEMESELAHAVVPHLLAQYLQRVSKSSRQDDDVDPNLNYYVAFNSGDHDRAWTLLRPRLDANPEDYPARQLRAILACERGRYPLMLFDAEQLLKVRPRALQAHWLRALAFLFSGKNNEAMNDLNLLLQSGWNDAWMHIAHAAAQTRLGAYAEALSDLEAALAQSPQEIAALFVRAEVRSKTGDHDGAVADLSEALKRDPENHRAYALRGQEYETLQQFEPAAKDFGAAFNLNGSAKMMGKWVGAQLRAGLTPSANPNLPVPPAAPTESTGLESEGRSRGGFRR